MFIFDFWFSLCGCFYMPSESHFYADSNAIIIFQIAPKLTEIWHILISIMITKTFFSWVPAGTQLNPIRKGFSNHSPFTYIFSFLACFYIPSELEFHAEFNAINHLSIWVELTELWGFLCLPSAYGNVYVFLFFIFCYFHVSIYHLNHIFTLIPMQQTIS